MSDYVETDIGEIPKDWEVKRLNEIAEQMYYGLSVSGVDTPTQYKLITTTSINKETFKLDEEKIPFCNLITNKDRKSKELTKYLVKKGDILISRSGTTGITILIDKDYNNMLFGSYLIKIRLNSIIDPKFFWYFAQSPFYWKQISSRGATIKNINLEILRNLRVPIPPLEEQKKIVEILNTVDSIIIDTTNLIEKLKLLKEKTLNSLITGKIWHKEFKDTEFGKIPKNWEVVKLGEIAVDIYRYPTYYNIKYVDMDKGVPEVRGELIKENGELEDDLSKYRFISKETSQRFSKTILHEDDFVLSVRGTLGKVAIVPKFLEGANITANLMKISLNRLKCYPPFFKQFFLSDFFRKNLDNISSQTTIKTIQASKLKSIKIPLPPLEEQKKIVEILSTIDNKIELETKYLEYLKRLKEKLLAALMMGKIRVNSIKINNLK